MRQRYILGAGNCSSDIPIRHLHIYANIYYRTISKEEEIGQFDHFLNLLPSLETIDFRNPEEMDLTRIFFELKNKSLKAICLQGLDNVRIMNLSQYFDRYFAEGLGYLDMSWNYIEQVVGAASHSFPSLKFLDFSNNRMLLFG